MTTKTSTAQHLKMSDFKSPLESVKGAKVHPLLRSTSTPNPKRSKKNQLEQRIAELECSFNELHAAWSEERRQLRMISDQLFDCTFPVAAGHMEAIRWFKDILNIDRGL